MSRHNLKPMSEIMEKLKSKGYTRDFNVFDDKMIMDHSKKVFSPEEIHIVDEYRFEGNTNPDDMSILYAIETKSGEKGMIVNGYGTSANPEIDAFLLAAEKDN